jgi:phosphatidylglycerophosphatase A
MKINSTTVFKYPSFFISTGFGIGLAPIAPGTFGSILGIVFFLLITPLYLSTFWMVIVLVAIFIISQISISLTLKRIDETDPQEVVIDEILGMMMTLTVIPLDPKWFLAAFVIFRVADIIKPWPASYFDEKYKNALGIILDDVFAALYSIILLEILLAILV